MKDIADVMRKLGKANNLMEDLIDLAMADTKISEDEKEMLHNINNNLSEYAKTIIETLKDGVVDKEEREKIKELENKIVTDAHAVARNDEKISEEEKTLLNRIIKMVQDLKY